MIERLILFFENQRLLTVLYLSVCILIGCENKNSIFPGGEQLVTNNDCSIDKLSWMEVSTEYDLTTQSRVSAQIETEFKMALGRISPLRLLSIDGGISVSPDISVKKMNEKHRVQTRKFKVSPEFFEFAHTHRESLCNLERYIKEGTINDKEILKTAQQKLVELNNNFSKFHSKKRTEVQSKLRPEKEQDSNLVEESSFILKDKQSIKLNKTQANISIFFKEFSGKKFAKLLVVSRGNKPVSLPIYNPGQFLEFSTKTGMHMATVLSVDFATKKVEVVVSKIN